VGCGEVRLGGQVWSAKYWGEMWNGYEVVCAQRYCTPAKHSSKADRCGGHTVGVVDRMGQVMCYGEFCDLGT
jgi:hypothetical protein